VLRLISEIIKEVQDAFWKVARVVFWKVFWVVPGSIMRNKMILRLFVFILDTCNLNWVVIILIFCCCPILTPLYHGKKHQP
jgi:hypothetical protein